MPKTKKLGLTLIECPGCHSRIDRHLVPFANLMGIIIGEVKVAADPLRKCPACGQESGTTLWKEHKV